MGKKKKKTAKNSKTSVAADVGEVKVAEAAKEETTQQTNHQQQQQQQQHTDNPYFREPHYDYEMTCRQVKEQLAAATAEMYQQQQPSPPPLPQEDVPDQPPEPEKVKILTDVDVVDLFMSR